MPGVYRQKTCPKCGKIHRRRGPYCCQSCASKSQVYTKERMDALKKRWVTVSQPHFQTPEGKAFRALQNVKDLVPEDFAIEIPDFFEAPEGYLTDDWS